MTVHELKTWPEPFQKVWDGVKTYEVRKDDRGFEVGDLLILREWKLLCPDGCIMQGIFDECDGQYHNHRCIQCGRPRADVVIRGEYIGRAITAEVTCKTTGWGLPDGLCVLGVKVTNRLDERYIVKEPE